MINHDDTICAIATALSPAGIGIIRVSGDKAIDIVSSIFVNKDRHKVDIKETHKIYYGYIFDRANDNFIDEVLILTMLKPKSYTAEDVVEIQCHGGLLVLKNILNLLVENGARIAEPGEFTKRAFLNGRIDLSKAESVSDIIMSKNDYALKASFNQLKGNLSEKLNSFRKELLESTAFIEACLDDPEHMSVEGFKPKLKTQCENIINELTTIIKNYDNGRLIKEGVNTVILGKPNVGKSSLLNTLLNEDRAIVTDIAGTTRDTIKESINLNGITLNIIDTAGIRNENNIDTVEKIGIDRAKNEAGKADLIILVLDSSKPLDKDDEELISLCKTLNKRTITLLNKADITGKDNINKTVGADIIRPSELCDPLISFSTKTKEGLSELTTTIEKLFINKELDFNNEIFISNERQLQSIKNAKTSLQNVLSSIENNMPEDLLTIDLTDSYTHLSQVLGIEVTDDLVNEIFSKFCMGK
ncbi:MAG: tRNA uridine-5-carboxymethylaminomethyl(34) synthesis GTPase MnmE [Lachnospiraceae bacterium]|nr:tRNA uridine-5-carboxymethylaminomethyl(34) synthesis GTPase MnmE [Lachnospiraceae bacterium]